MRIARTATPADAATYAARLIAGHIRDAIRVRGQACIALSGGSTAVALVDALAELSVDWPAVHLFQVDERVAPRGDAARNLTTLEQRLVSRGGVPFRQLHPLWVDRASLDEAAAAAGNELAALAGAPPVLDVVHLGLGADGHTASLFPGDPALAVSDRSVVVTGEHAGFRRLTLTLPVINAARAIVWLVTGKAKADMVRVLATGEGGIPAAAVRRDQAVLVTDGAAAALLPVGGA